MPRPKVTVYIPSQNYGRFLEESIDSVLRQSLSDWELILVDDGSEDETAAICRRYSEMHPGKVQWLRFDRPEGLRTGANRAIERARGEYIIRLDADDYLDESALLILSDWLDRNHECALVYPNWIYVSEKGDYLGIENRKRIGDEVEVLDLPAHGACTMVRRRVLKSIGGYDPMHDSQDGHELWLKIVREHRVGNVATPLFFYRQHGTSMSTNESRLISSRQKIKRRLAERDGAHVKPTVVAVVPAKKDTFYLENLPMLEVGGHHVIDYTTDQALEFGFDAVVVSSDDEATLEHCSGQPGMIPLRRSEELSKSGAGISKVLATVVEELETDRNIFADIVVMLGIATPMRTMEHIQEALDTLQLYDVDSVISVSENRDLHFVHDKHGLRPLSRSSLSQLRFERDALLVGNGAIYVTWRDLLDPESLFSGRVGHIVMPRLDSLQLRYPEDLGPLDLLLARRAEEIHAG